LYRDDDLVVVDKPAGLLVHRGWAADRDVVMTRVRDQLGAWVYPVHRLDRGASGALILALSRDAARAVGDAFCAGRVRKSYIAVVRGDPPEAGVIDHPLPRRPGGPRVRAVTRYRRVAASGRYAVVCAAPETGRLHQIRRHLKHISCPLIGDVKYGKGPHNRLFRDRYDLHRLALHAAAIQLPHPADGRPITALAPLPADLAGALAGLGLGDEAVRVADTARAMLADARADRDSDDSAAIGDPAGS
jgi:tRNA pseudouridine65 synthase